MKQSIQKNMILILTATLLISYALLAVVIYRHNVSTMEEEVVRETDYICQAAELSGLSAEALPGLDTVSADTRITWVDKDGSVKFDSKEDEQTLENHLQRPEIQAALKDGSGKGVRRSATLGQQMFYYAKRLSDGTVLRVSKTMNFALWSAIHIVPPMLGIFVVMIALAMVVSARQVNRLIRPINELNLAAPSKTKIYPELRPLVERIERTNQEKEAMENMRKEFSANVSHELKTPLTSISGYAEIMKSGLVKPEDIGRFSGRIYNESSRLIVLIDDIIKLSCLDEGRVGPERSVVDLYTLTREIVSRLAPQAVARHISLEVTGESVLYEGVAQVLDEMIYNLVENAIKYNKEHGKVSVWVGDTLHGKKVIVSDTGIGIPKEEQERIFERFYRVDKSHSKAIGGTGLGLSIVKHGAALHGAHVHVESTPGEGTRMELIFPEMSESAEERTGKKTDGSLTV